MLKKIRGFISRYIGLKISAAIISIFLGWRSYVHYYDSAVKSRVAQIEILSSQFDYFSKSALMQLEEFNLKSASDEIGQMEEILSELKKVAEVDQSYRKRITMLENSVQIIIRSNIDRDIKTVVIKSSDFSPNEALEAKKRRNVQITKTITTIKNVQLALDPEFTTILKGYVRRRIDENAKTIGTKLKMEGYQILDMQMYLYHELSEFVY